jgi:ComF family protein
VQAVIWPPTCVLCGGAGQHPTLDLCTACEADLPRNVPACSVCAQPLSDANTALPCGACLRRPPRFDATYCPFRYAYPVDRLVQAIKYRGAVAPGRVLGELVARGVQQRNEALPGILVPVPLGQQRFRQRGYNQAIELGRWLEKRLGIPMRTDLVARIRETGEQALLDRRERRKNIRGAFAVLRELPAMHVAVIDDVITTGSTVSELTRVLKQAGAKRVEVWAVARAGAERG